MSYFIRRRAVSTHFELAKQLIIFYQLIQIYSTNLFNSFILALSTRSTHSKNECFFANSKYSPEI